MTPPASPGAIGGGGAPLIRAVAFVALLAVGHAALTGPALLPGAPTTGDRLALSWALVAVAVMLYALWRPLSPATCGGVGAAAAIGLVLLATGPMGGRMHSSVLSVDAARSARRALIWAESRSGRAWRPGEVADDRAALEAARLAALSLLILGAEGVLVGCGLRAAAGFGRRGPDPRTRSAPMAAGALLLGGGLLIGFAYPSYADRVEAPPVALDLVLLAGSAVAGALGMMLGLEPRGGARRALGLAIVYALIGTIAVENLAGARALRPSIRVTLLTIDLAVVATVALVPLCFAAWRAALAEEEARAAFEEAPTEERDAPAEWAGVDAARVDRGRAEDDEVA